MAGQAQEDSKLDASVDPSEVEKFAALAAQWWDPAGKFRPLHQLNPVRVAYVRDRVATHVGRDPLSEQPLSGLRILDIGCGGGLLSEPLTRLGASVTAIDITEENLAVARLHAEESGLDIDYRNSTAEALAETGAHYDAVVSMEVLEHVADVGAFLEATAALVRPGGAIALATLNRTPKSFLLGIVAAEYLLRWLPTGTHDWRRFLRPSEVVRHLASHGVETQNVSGVSFNPLTESWRLARDTDVNYMIFAVKDD